MKENNSNPDLPKIQFSSKGNFDIFAGIFGDSRFLTLLIELFQSQPKSVRTIIFPSESDIRKAVAHRYGKLVINGICSWKKVAEFMKNDDFFIDSWEAKRLYFQAEKELEKAGKNREDFIEKMKDKYIDIMKKLRIEKGL